MSDEQLPEAGRIGVPRALTPFFASMQERTAQLGQLAQLHIEPQLELLAFSMGAEAFALRVADIVEVVGLARPFALPQVGPEVLGIMRLRGQVVPLLDLQRLMGVFRAAEPPAPKASLPLPARRRVVVLRDAAPLGVVVEQVLGVVRLGHNQLHAAPPQGQGLLLGLGHGTVHGTLRVLDAPTLLQRYERLL